VYIADRRRASLSAHGNFGLSRTVALGSSVAPADPADEPGEWNQGTLPELTPAIAALIRPKRYGVAQLASRLEAMNGRHSCIDRVPVS
jgi:hypothetical protein